MRYVVIVVIALGAYTLWYNWPAIREADRKKQAAMLEERRADAKPRLVSTGADGCKVYAFKPQDRWLYFTSCPNANTATNNQWSETQGSGKSARTVTKDMTIEARP